MDIRLGLTFDDVLLVPAESDIVPSQTNTATRVTRGISLDIPILSSAMDTVTEARLAIAIAQEGGMGIVHKNLTPQQQAAEVARVKRYESGVLRDPVVITPQHTVRQVIAMQEQLGISGFPVLDGGKLKVLNTLNQDSPYMAGQAPILGVDVWEHAYYLKYQNKRPDYLDAWWNTVNWTAVEKRYTEAKAKG